MSRWPFVLVFGVVFLVVTGLLGWATEEVLFRWVGRRYRLKPKQVRMRSLASVNGRWSLFIIQTLHVGGISLAAYLGIQAGIIAMALALEVLH